MSWRTWLPRDDPGDCAILGDRKGTILGRNPLIPGTLPAKTHEDLSAATQDGMGGWLISGVSSVQLETADCFLPSKWRPNGRWTAES